jgi:hypothetical protein
MLTEELMVCKAAAAEAFPEKGWLGIIDKGNKSVKQILSRSSLYKEASRIMKRYGEDEVRKIVRDFRVPKDHCLTFVSTRDAMNRDQARTIFETFLLERE